MPIPPSTWPMKPTPGNTKTGYWLLTIRFMDCRKLLTYVLWMLPAISMAQDTTYNRLSEVEVTDTRQSNFGHLYQVDGMKIAAGKKSEVINVEHLNVNKATNNTRQVYAKVA